MSSGHMRPRRSRPPLPWSAFSPLRARDLSKNYAWSTQAGITVATSTHQPWKRASSRPWAKPAVPSDVRPACRWLRLRGIRSPSSSPKHQSPAATFPTISSRKFRSRLEPGPVKWRWQLKWVRRGVLIDGPPGSAQLRSQCSRRWSDWHVAVTWTRGSHIPHNVVVVRNSWDDLERVRPSSSPFPNSRCRLHRRNTPHKTQIRARIEGATDG